MVTTTKGYIIAITLFADSYCNIHAMNIFMMEITLNDFTLESESAPIIYTYYEI